MAQIEAGRMRIDREKEKYTETTVRFFRSNVDFLTTDKVQADPRFNRNQRRFSTTGKNLPEQVCDKILYKNAKGLIKID